MRVVVFDVNIYLDVARLLGAPFSWDRYQAFLRDNRSAYVPNGSSSAIDSAFAISHSLSGEFSGGVGLQVWTSNHIDNLVMTKAGQPSREELEARAAFGQSVRDEDCGLGWTSEASELLVHDLVYTVVYDETDGGSVGDITFPIGNPPLDHEDGKVFATARMAGCEVAGEQCVTYCVTRDHGFRHPKTPLPRTVTVLYPHEWIALLRKARYTARSAKPEMLRRVRDRTH